MASWSASTYRRVRFRPIADNAVSSVMILYIQICQRRRHRVSRVERIDKQPEHAVADAVVLANVLFKTDDGEKHEGGKGCGRSRHADESQTCLSGRSICPRLSLIPPVRHCRQQKLRSSLGSAEIMASNHWLSLADAPLYLRFHLSVKIKQQRKVVV